MSRDSALYNGDFWQYHQIIQHKEVSKDHPGYYAISTNVRVLWENEDKTDKTLQIMDTHDDTFDKEGNLVNNSQSMLNLGDDIGNTICNRDHIGSFSNDIHPDSHLIGNVLSIGHIVFHTTCVCIGNLGDPTNPSDTFSVSIAAPGNLFDPTTLVFFH